MTALDLDAVQTRYANIAASAHLKLGYAAAAFTSATDIPALVAEVENLLVEREWPSVHDLADAHARYHDQAGNLLYENDCEWLRCEFWGSVTLLLSLRPGSSGKEPTA
jgi:hypothetical protein